MKLVLELNDLEYEDLLLYYHCRGFKYESELVGIFAKHVLMNGIESGLVYGKKRMSEWSDICVEK